MEINASSVRKKLRPQIRGKELESRIEIVIRELASDLRLAGKEFVFNSTLVASLVPTTRRTLAKHEELIDRVVNELKSRRRMSNGHASFELMQDQVTYLKEQIKEKEKEILQLRNHHIEIYKRFHAESLHAESLIRPIMEGECNDSGFCIFCETQLDKTKQLVRKTNVIDITGRLEK